MELMQYINIETCPDDPTELPPNSRPLSPNIDRSVGTVIKLSCEYGYSAMVPFEVTCKEKKGELKWEICGSCKSV